VRGPTLLTRRQRGPGIVQVHDPLNGRGVPARSLQINSHAADATASATTEDPRCHRIASTRIAQTQITAGRRARASAVRDETPASVRAKRASRCRCPERARLVQGRRLAGVGAYDRIRAKSSAPPSASASPSKATATALGHPSGLSSRRRAEPGVCAQPDGRAALEIASAHASFAGAKQAASARSRVAHGNLVANAAGDDRSPRCESEVMLRVRDPRSAVVGAPRTRSRSRGRGRRRVRSPRSGDAERRSQRCLGGRARPRVSSALR
jgi:hypothetical protein